ncbi:MAG: hypothetical protein IPP94_11565 [Ignavibacteria bacterium]|nr:hypothetical protein [Ignavibacteria bacterium]
MPLVRAAPCCAADGGTTWTPQLSGTNEELFSISFAGKNAGTAVGYNGAIIHTTDGGTSWATQARQAGMLNCVAQIDSLNATAVGSSGNIIRSSDGGVTWLKQTSGTNLWLEGVSFRTPSAGLVVGDSGIILRSEDGGATWVRQESGTSERLMSVAFRGDSSATAVGDQGVILGSNDGGRSWALQNEENDVLLNGVSFFDEKNGLAVGWKILETTNGGLEWKEQEQPAQWVQRSVLCMDPDNAIVVG